jgi:hypothetical protein
MNHPQFAPAWVKHNAVRGAKSHKPAFDFIQASRKFLCQFLVSRGMTFLDEGRHDVMMQ